MPRAPSPRDPTRACYGAAVGGVFAVLACFVGYLEQRGYGLGIVEAIATTIFIGFACDYCCHVAQARSSVRLRLSRSRSRSLRLETSLSAPRACAHSSINPLASLCPSPSRQVHASVAVRSGGGGDGGGGGGGGGGGEGEGGGGPRGAERLTRMLVHAGPSLYGAALTTVGAALPLLFCYVVVFRQMGEFISVCTGFSFAVALTLIAPAVCVAADLAGGCRRQQGSADGRGSDTSTRNVPCEPRSLRRVLARIAMPTNPFCTASTAVPPTATGAPCQTEMASPP